jgi:drug/metabolite transporter (DMT)-like permease
MFVMLGAALILRETVSRDRWLAAVFGFAGVGLVLFPHMQAATGNWSLVMLAASPLFAASFLINKALTRHDRPEVIVLWQNIIVTAYMIPLALPYWVFPDTRQWFMLSLCGLLGTLAHVCMTRGFALADISVLQPFRFLDLLWASLFGFLMFGALPSETAILGGIIIVSATLWIAHREKRQ